jgi:hypothetical protein
MADAADEPEDFPPTWVLLRPLKDPWGVPASIRFRRALKCLLRSYGIRVERVTGKLPQEVEQSEQTTSRAARVGPAPGPG